MLGTVLAALTNSRVAEEALGQLADPALLARVRAAAAKEELDIGVFVASTVRQMLEHGEETLWLSVVGRMSNDPRPAMVALQAILARAFPPPADTGGAPPRVVIRSAIERHDGAER